MCLTDEHEWHLVPEYIGLYVTVDGRVKCARRGVLIPSNNGKGYLYVRVKGDNRGWHTQGVHRLVLRTFAGPPNGRQGAHNNGDRGDNRIENLRWATPKENAQDKLEHNTWFRHTSFSQREQCGILRAQGYTYREIAKIVGISLGYAHRLANKSSKYPPAGGYRRQKID